MLNRHKCERVVTFCKEEKPNFQSRIWWNKLFKKLEAEASIPPEKKYDVLRTIFPKNLLQKIAKLIDLDENERKKFLETIQMKFPCEGPLTFPSIAPIYYYGGKYTEEESISSLSHLSEFLSSSSSEHEPLKQVGKGNPYLKFFQTRKDRASIWRPMPPLALADMNLVQKAEAITERIAEEFVKWLQEMGGDSTSNINVETIISMFEIGFNTHAAKSLCVRLKEMPTVPDLVAKKRNVPEMAKRASLLRQIYRDIQASKLEPKRIAFGKALPPSMQRVQIKEDIAKKWLECKNVPIKLKTMQTVWEGITHLRSTRAYCDWLLHHPEIDPPQYLVDNNLLDPKVVQNRRFSMDDDEMVLESGSETVVKGFSKPKLLSDLNIHPSHSNIAIGSLSRRSESQVLA